MQLEMSAVKVFSLYWIPYRLTHAEEWPWFPVFSKPISLIQHIVPLIKFMAHLCRQKGDLRQFSLKFTVVS